MRNKLWVNSRALPLSILSWDKPHTQKTKRQTNKSQGHSVGEEELFFQILFSSKTELSVYQNRPEMYLIRTANHHNNFNYTYHFSLYSESQYIWKLDSFAYVTHLQRKKNRNLHSELQHCLFVLWYMCQEWTKQPRTLPLRNFYPVEYYMLATLMYIFHRENIILLFYIRTFYISQLRKTS